MEENEENLKTQQVPSFQSLKYEVESLFNQFISEDVKTNYEELEILLSKLLKELKVPLLFSQLDDQEIYSPKSFQESKKEAEKFSKEAEKYFDLLKKLIVYWSSLPEKMFSKREQPLIDLIISCSSFASNVNWSTLYIQKLYKEILNVISNRLKFNSIQELIQSKIEKLIRRIYPQFVGNENSFLIEAGKKIREEDFVNKLQLVVESDSKLAWKQDITLKYILHWLVTQVEYPYLSPIIQMILQMTFSLLSDFEIVNKVFGIKILQHLISNIDNVEIHWYRIPLLNILNRLLVFRDSEFTVVLIPCIIQSIKIFNSTPDAQVNILISNLLKEYSRVSYSGSSERKLQMIYLKEIGPLFDLIGIKLTKYFNILIPAITTFIGINDSILQENALLNFQHLIRLCWIRISIHKESLFNKLNETEEGIRDCYHYSEDTKQNLLKKVFEAKDLLNLCSDQYNYLLKKKKI